MGVAVDESQDRPAGVCRVARFTRAAGCPGGQRSPSYAGIGQACRAALKAQSVLKPKSSKIMT